MQAQTIFDKLWEDYTAQNPDVKKVYNLFEEEGEEVVNDHIAFRTFNDRRVNIEVLAKPFLKAGYIYKDSYEFKDKHLTARHYEFEPFKNAPRVFISQLKLEELSSSLRQIAISSIDNIPMNLLKSEELIFSGRTWGTPSYRIYENLRSESEYAAWVYVYGFRVNHFTVSVNFLNKYNTIQKVNEFLKKNGFLLNDSGGEIKGSPGKLLEQSSIKAGIKPVKFLEGTYEIPSCYYEFARRYPDKDGRLFSGFIAKSADKIFESTDYYSRKKRKG
ncbi:MAG: DUF1338 domain-containing protein [Bacteroidales bacterium]|nr:DUF1338 domain-containing protein [Bacteroidales bacterium]